MCNYFLFWLNVEKSLFGELGHTHFCLSSAGRENPDVYVASDVPKRTSLNLIDVNPSTVHSPHLVKLGRGYRRNATWVSLRVGSSASSKIKSTGIYFDEILAGSFTFDIFEVEEAL